MGSKQERQVDLLWGERQQGDQTGGSYTVTRVTQRSKMAQWRGARPPTQLGSESQPCRG